MKVKAINCNYLFTKDYIEEIIDTIKRYNQGFMNIAGTLYLPYYQVLRMTYVLPDNIKTTIVDTNDMINGDSLAQHFDKTNTLDVTEIIDLYHAMQLNDDFTELLDVVDEIATARYEQGFNDGYDM